jgi:hypothetical protein
MFKDDIGKEIKDRNRIRIEGTVGVLKSATAGSLTIDQCGFEIFFHPRIKNREFYHSDTGTTKVRFLVAFTYEKPEAFDVCRVSP